MDISFTCDKCGKKLVIDNAGAGITIDCPECGKAVYVPSSAPPPKPKDPPARVEPKPLPRVAAPNPPQPPVPAPRAVIPSLSRDLLSSTVNQKSAVHPSIAAGVHCLVILVGIELVGLLALRQNPQLGVAFLYASAPFLIAPLLCAVYGMCAGHVRHGLLVLAGLSLIIGMSYWAEISMMTLVGADAQRQMQQMLQQQMQNFQKAFPQPAPHP